MVVVMGAQGDGPCLTRSLPLLLPEASHLWALTSRPPGWGVFSRFLEEAVGLPAGQTGLDSAVCTKACDTQGLAGLHHLEMLGSH